MSERRPFNKGGYLRPGLTLVAPKHEIALGSEAQWRGISEALAEYAAEVSARKDGNQS